MNHLSSKSVSAFILSSSSVPPTKTVFLFESRHFLMFKQKVKLARPTYILAGLTSLPHWASESWSLGEHF